MALNHKVLDNVINAGDIVIVGVSGGADSMCLLDLVNKYRKVCDFKLIAVHINHGLRGSEAKRDEHFVADFCKNSNINFLSREINTKQYKKEQGKTIEQAARELRYKEFYKIISETGANKLLIAHNKDDQAETVLMHIARGSALKGASGMKKNIDIIYRPLLNFTRKEIEQYNIDKNIKNVEDSSNVDTIYSRNFLRKEIIPLLEKKYPNIVNALCLFAERCYQDEEFIQKQLPLSLIEEEKNKIKISTDIKTLDYSLSSRLVRKAVEKLGVFSDVEEKHINEILNLVNKQNGKQINLPHEIIAVKEYEYISLYREPEKSRCFESVFKEGIINVDGFGEVNVEVLENMQNIDLKDGCHYCDLNKISETAVWRFREKGDLFTKFSGGTISLSDYLIDKKIPKFKRDHIPILAEGNRALVIANIAISEDVKVDRNSDKVVKISYKIFV